MALVWNIMTIKDALEASDLVTKSNSFTMVSNMNLQVFGVVVLLVTILVVYSFISGKRTAQFLGHNQSVLQNSWAFILLPHWLSQFLIFLTQAADSKSDISLTGNMSFIGPITRVWSRWIARTVNAKARKTFSMSDPFHYGSPSNPSVLTASSTGYKEGSGVFAKYFPIIPVNNTPVLKLNKFGLYWRNASFSWHNLILSLISMSRMCCNYNTQSQTWGGITNWP